MTTKTRVLAAMAAVPLLAVATLAIAQGTKGGTPPPPDPVQTNKDVRAGTQGLEADVNAAMKNLDKISKDVPKLKNQAADAKKKADAAEAAAEAARVAANHCETEADKAKIQKQIDDAQKKLDDAQNAKNTMDNTEKGIRDNIKKTTDAVNQRVNDLGKQADAALKGAKSLGYADNSVATGNLRDAKAALDQKVSQMQSDGTQEKGFKDQGSMSKLDSAANSFNPAIRKAKENNDPADALKGANQKLQDAKDALKDCPKKTGMAPVKPPTEVFVGVDNRPQSLVCVADGQNVDQAVNQLGLTESMPVASAPGSGTVVRTPTDASTVDKAAKDKGVKLCFPTEGDFCMIMTPLTPFRGHDHNAHMLSGRGVHDHDGPNPPLDWGVDPPVTVIILEPDR